MTRFHVAAAVITAAAAVAGSVLAAPDAGRGATLFADQCSSCHAFAPGENGIGPSLHGAFGHPTGRQEGFSYSPGLASHKAVWTEANLDRFLSNPQAFSPGSEMPVAVPSAKDRTDLIAYLAKAAR
jgi:cytochrome c